MTREVHEKMIEMWATRYMAIHEKHGKEASAAWSNAFLNQEDFHRVTTAIKEKRYVRPV